MVQATLVNILVRFFKAIPQGVGDVSIDDESELFAMTIFKGEYEIVEEEND